MPAGGPGGAWRAASVTTAVAALAAAGVEIVTPVTEAPGGWSADFKDPDGHLLSFYQDGKLPR